MARVHVLAEVREESALVAPREDVREFEIPPPHKVLHGLVRRLGVAETQAHMREIHARDEGRALPRGYGAQGRGQGLRGRVLMEGNAAAEQFVHGRDIQRQDARRMVRPERVPQEHALELD